MMVHKPIHNKKIPRYSRWLFDVLMDDFLEARFFGVNLGCAISSSESSTSPVTMRSSRFWLLVLALGVSRGNRCSPQLSNTGGPSSSSFICDCDGDSTLGSFAL
eukprot:scaffold40539_cov45-Cyclotella_meneghiniana.AAC.2